MNSEAMMKSSNSPVKSKAHAFVDISPFLRRSVVVNEKIKANLSETRRRVVRLRAHLEKFSVRLAELEAEDKLGNFEIQDLMSQFNEAESLASSVLKKRDDTANAVIGKI
ncbi:MAG: hypothetical protein H7125_00405 [Proteobacteria bacterium]|nr:hypothetical protein [Burkholderiales bacterium]